MKEIMKLNWNFQRGGRVLEKIPAVGEVWIFSGITHSVPDKRRVSGQKPDGNRYLTRH